MDEAPDRHPPFADAAAAVEDIATAVTFILGQHGARRLDLVGFSWGTITSARFAGRIPTKLRGLCCTRRFIPTPGRSGSVPKRMNPAKSRVSARID
jgi:pimeloyl-ACP methyl ester carboxylesterase